MTERLRRAGHVAWALVGVAVLVTLLGLLVWTFRPIFPFLVLTGAIVFLLNPVVTRLAEGGIPRPAAAGLTYLGVIALVALAGLLLLPVVVDQGRDLSERWPEIRRSLQSWVDARAEESEGTFYEFSRDELESALSADGLSLADQLGRLAEVGTQVFHVLLVLVLSPIIAFYLLVDLPHVREVCVRLVPAGAKPEVMVIARRLNRAIGGFFRGQLVVATLVGILCSLGLALIDLPFWLLIGMIAGLFNIVPLIGPWIGGVPGVLVALTTRDPTTALWVVAIMVGAQQIDNHFITPQVMQRAVRLHPAVVILALLTGGTLWGFFGLLLAVPGAAVIKIVLGHLWRVHVLGEPVPEVEREQAAEDSEQATGVVEDILAPRPHAHDIGPSDGADVEEVPDRAVSGSSRRTTSATPSP